MIILYILLFLLLHGCQPSDEATHSNDIEFPAESKKPMNKSPRYFPKELAVEVVNDPSESHVEREDPDNSPIAATGTEQGPRPDIWFSPFWIDHLVGKGAPRGPSGAGIPAAGGGSSTGSATPGGGGGPFSSAMSVASSTGDDDSDQWSMTGSAGSGEEDPDDWSVSGSAGSNWSRLDDRDYDDKDERGDFFRSLADAFIRAFCARAFATVEEVDRQLAVTQRGLAELGLVDHRPVVNCADRSKAQLRGNAVGAAEGILIRIGNTQEARRLLSTMPNLSDEDRAQLLARLEAAIERRLAEIIGFLRTGLKSNDKVEIGRVVAATRAAFNALNLENAEDVWRIRFQSEIDEPWAHHGIDLTDQFRAQERERLGRQAIVAVERITTRYTGEVETEGIEERVVSQADEAKREIGGVVDLPENERDTRLKTIDSIKRNRVIAILLSRLQIVLANAQDDDGIKRAFELTHMELRRLFPNAEAVYEDQLLPLIEPARFSLAQRLIDALAASQFKELTRPEFDARLGRIEEVVFMISDGYAAKSELSATLADWRRRVIESWIMDFCESATGSLDEVQRLVTEYEGKVPTGGDYHQRLEVCAADKIVEYYRVLLSSAEAASIEDGKRRTLSAIQTLGNLPRDLRASYVRTIELMSVARLAGTWRPWRPLSEDAHWAQVRAWLAALPKDLSLLTDQLIQGRMARIRPALSLIPADARGQLSEELNIWEERARKGVAFKVAFCRSRFANPQLIQEAAQRCREFLESLGSRIHAGVDLCVESEFRRLRSVRRISRSFCAFKRFIRVSQANDRWQQDKATLEQLQADEDTIRRLDECLGIHVETILGGARILAARIVTEFRASSAATLERVRADAGKARTEIGSVHDLDDTARAEFIDNINSEEERRLKKFAEAMSRQVLEALYAKLRKDELSMEDINGAVAEAKRALVGVSNETDMIDSAGKEARIDLVKREVEKMERGQGDENHLETLLSEAKRASSETSETLERLEEQVKTVFAQRRAEAELRAATEAAKQKAYGIVDGVRRQADPKSFVTTRKAVLEAMVKVRQLAHLSPTEISEFVNQIETIGAEGALTESDRL
jgi:hypothetical protein